MASWWRFFDPVVRFFRRGPWIPRGSHHLGFCYTDDDIGPRHELICLNPEGPRRHAVQSLPAGLLRSRPPAGGGGGVPFDDFHGFLGRGKSLEASIRESGDPDFCISAALPSLRIKRISIWSTAAVGLFLPQLDDEDCLFAVTKLVVVYEYKSADGAMREACLVRGRGDVTGNSMLLSSSTEEETVLLGDGEVVTGVFGTWWDDDADGTHCFTSLGFRILDLATGGERHCRFLHSRRLMPEKHMMGIPRCTPRVHPGDATQGSEPEDEASVVPRGQPFSFQAPPGFSVTGFYGRDKDVISSLGVYFRTLLHWSENSHRFFPAHFKAEVCTLLLCWRKGLGDSPVTKIGSDELQCIIAVLAAKHLDRELGDRQEDYQYRDLRLCGGVRICT